jgi:hypothetical protein
MTVKAIHSSASARVSEDATDPAVRASDQTGSILGPLHAIRHTWNRPELPFF